MIFEAINFAAHAHKGQIRKGANVPFISHPYSVGMILMKAGCSEEIIVAGILHDTIEDTYVTIEDIREQFGKKVVSLVKSCTFPAKGLTWEERKKKIISLIRKAPHEVMFIESADKLHNLISIEEGIRTFGEHFWSFFKEGKDKQEWYYRGIIKALNDNDFENEILDKMKDFVEKIFV